MVPTGQQCQGGATVAKVSKFEHYKFRDIQKTDFQILFCHENGTQREIFTKFLSSFLVYSLYKELGMLLYSWIQHTHSTPATGRLACSNVRPVAAACLQTSSGTLRKKLGIWHFRRTF
jgi:hypothetical protein